MHKELYDERFEEEKLACKERAGWQCEAILPWTNERCPTKDGDEKWSRRSNRKWIVYLHAAHVNNDPENPHAELVCLCPSCHMRMDRAKQKLERTSQRRRGYELTSTDRLVETVSSAGLRLTPVSEGFHWNVEGTEYEGNATTAVSAVSHAIARLRSEVIFQRNMRDGNRARPPTKKRK